MTDVDRVDQALAKGGLVLLPTETVYGLGVDPRSDLAVKTLYTVKGRDFNKPLALCVRDLEQAEAYGVFNDLARALTKRFWPGPLTLILPAKDNTGLNPNLYGIGEAGRRTTAFRCPQARWTLALKALPIGLTSANRSGEPDPKTYAEAYSNIGAFVDASLEGTAKKNGGVSPSRASTILALNGNRATLLRQGDLWPEDFSDFNIEWEP